MNLWVQLYLPAKYGFKGGHLAPDEASQADILAFISVRNQRRLTAIKALEQLNPDAAAPGLAVCRGLDAALNGEDPTPILLAEAKRAGGKS